MKKYFIIPASLAILAVIFSIGCQTKEKSVEPEAVAQVESASEQKAEPKENKTDEAQQIVSEKIEVAAAVKTDPVKAETKTQPVAEPQPVAVKTDVKGPNVPQIPLDINKPGVLVNVNGVDITQAELDDIIKPMIESRLEMNQPTPETLLDQYKSQVLDNLITELLINQEYKANNITVTDQDVNDYVQKMLAAQDPPMSQDEFKKMIEMQGQTYEQWKNMMRDGRLKMQKLMEVKYPEETKVSEEDAKKFYGENSKYFDKPEKVRASHILVKADKSDPNVTEQVRAAAKAKAESLLKKVKEGADFADLAKANSDDTFSAQKGGDLGIFDKGTMVPEFSEAAFKLKPDQISDVVETQYGYHIIKVTGRTEASVVPFEKTKVNIVDYLKTRKMQTLVPEFIKKIKEDAKIVYPPGSTLRAYQPSTSTIRKPAVDLLKPATTQKPATAQPQTSKPDANKPAGGQN